MSPSPPPSSTPSSSDLQHHRPVLFVVLVAFLLYFSGVTLAQEVPVDNAIDSGLDHGLVVDEPIHSPIHHAVSPPNQNGSIQFDGVTALMDPHLPMTVTHGKRVTAGRPASVDLYASLANLDSDAEPDGWRAQVVLRDSHGSPLRMRSRATFELVPRIPLVGTRRHGIGHFKPLKWSQPLHYDERGVASVTLPLRRELHAVYGWSTLAKSPPFGTVDSGGRFRSIRTSDRYNQSIFTATWREQIEMPSKGILKVRVSVPTAGVYEATTPVRLRPALW